MTEQHEEQPAIGGRAEEGVMAELDGIPVPMFNLPQYLDKKDYETAVKVMLHRYVRDEDDVKVKVIRNGKQKYEWEITVDCRDPGRIMGYLRDIDAELVAMFEPEPPILPDEEATPPDDTSGKKARPKTGK